MMFRNKPQIFNLATVLNTPEDYEFSGSNSSCGLESSYAITSKTHGPGGQVVTKTLQDIASDAFNIFNLCKYWSKHPRSGSYGIPSLIFHYFLHLETLSASEKDIYVTRFFGHTTYDELHALHPQVAEALMSNLMDFGFGKDKSPRFYGIKPIPAIILQYADFLARKFSALPAELMQEFDLLQASAGCHYQTMPTECIEGYWQENYVNKDIFAVAKSYTNDKLIFSPEDLQKLKAIVLEKEQPTDEKRYPIPEPTAWAHKDRFLACLNKLEELAQHEPEKTRAILRLRIQDETLIDALLPVCLTELGYMGPSGERLPINYYTWMEYQIKLPDGTQFGWTQALKKYIEVYNVLPSKEFFAEFSNTLQYCQSFYRDAGNKVRDYLDAHPFELEPAKSYGMRR